MNTYEMVIEVCGKTQVRVPFQLDWEGKPELGKNAIERIFTTWQAQYREGQTHYRIRNNGEIVVIYTDITGQTVNDAQLDGDWNMPLRWLDVLVPGDFAWGRVIGQAEPETTVKVTDAVEAVIARYNAEEGDERFTLTDMRYAAQEAALAALAGS